MNHQTFKERLEEIQKTALNDFYDYITEHDIIKVAEEYSNKTILKTSVESLITLFEDYTKEIVEYLPKEVKAEMPNTTTYAYNRAIKDVHQTIKQTSKTILKGESDEL